MAISPPTHLFGTVFSVERNTPTKDSSGSPADSWAAHLSNLKGRFQPMSGSEAIRYGRESTRNMWRVFTAPGVDIQAKDRVVFTDKTSGVTTSRTLDVQETKNAQLAGVVLRLICQETQ